MLLQLIMSTLLSKISALTLVGAVLTENLSRYSYAYLLNNPIDILNFDVYPSHAILSVNLLNMLLFKFSLDRFLLVTFLSN